VGLSACKSLIRTPAGLEPCSLGQKVAPGN
jgi:hypothetical protein